MVASYTNLIILLTVEPVLSRIDPLWFLANMFYNNKTRIERIGVVIPSAGIHFRETVIKKAKKVKVRGWMKAKMYVMHPTKIKRKHIILITGHIEGSDESVSEMYSQTAYCNILLATTSDNHIKKEWLKESWLEGGCLLTYKLVIERNIPAYKYMRFNFFSGEHNFHL